MFTVGKIHPTGNFTITPGAYDTHGISVADLEGCLDTEEALGLVLTKLKKIKGKRPNLVVVGHKVAAFDLTLLLKEMTRCDLNQNKLTRIVTHTVDTLELAQKDEVWEDIKEERPASLTLGSLYECFFEDELPCAHSALGDVKANLAILLKLDPTLKFASKYKKPINELLSLEE